MSLSLSTLFSSLNNNNKNNATSLFSSGSNFGVNLSDYATIKSGAYYKMMKKYYAIKQPSSSEQTQGSSSSTSTSKDTTDTLVRIENASDAAKDAADDLLTKGSKSVFNKVEKTDDKGIKTFDYDEDAIYKKVCKFADSYNKMLDQAEKAESTNILSTAASTVKYTKHNEKMLASVGITVGADNKLTVDEKAFKSADMSTVKSMFNTTGSFGYQISAKASMVNYYAQQAASKSNTYGNNGMYSYNYSSGQIYNSRT